METNLNNLINQKIKEKEKTIKPKPFDGRTWITNPTIQKLEPEKQKDIIIQTTIYEKVYNADKTITIKPTIKKTNISAAIRESAKLLKINHAQQMQEELNNFFTITEKKEI